MAQFNATHEADCDDGRIERARKILRQWEKRTESVHVPQREHQRMPYDGQPVVAVENVQRDRSTEVVTFFAWGLDISRSGVSFLIPADVRPSLEAEGAQIIHLPKLLVPGREVTLGMLQNTGFRMW